MKIRKALYQDGELVYPLMAAFRRELRQLKGLSTEIAAADIRDEWEDAHRGGSPVFLCMEGTACVGYLVCRVDAPAVWVEALYVTPQARRTGAATALFHEAEALAARYGENTVYNYIHPNNHAVIAFLDKLGYRVLNLVEVRKPYPGEPPRSPIQVGEHQFEY